MAVQINQETVNDTAKLVMHRLVARAIARDPSIVERAKLSLAKASERFSGRTFIEDWEKLLNLPIAEIRFRLVSRSQEMTRLRSSSPLFLAGGVNFKDQAFRKRISAAARRVAMRGAARDPHFGRRSAAP
jgi:hypothetical protein